MSKQCNWMLMEPLEVYSMVAKGQLGKFPNNYLDKDSIKEIVRHVILNIYGYSRDDVTENVNHDFFMGNYLGGARKFFNKSDIELLVYCFPEWDLRPWEFKRVQGGFWRSSDNRREFIIWLAEKEGLNPYSKEGLRKITAEVLNKYGGSKALLYAGGLYELLDSVCPGKYMKWEIIKMSSWTEQETVEAIHWLIEEKLRYTPEQVCKMKVAEFDAYNLGGMLQKGCGHSIMKALELAYPGKYYRKNSRTICYRE